MTPIGHRHMGHHAMMAAPHHDDLAREDFVEALHGHVLNTLLPGNKQAYDRRALPAFERQAGRAPKTRQEVRAAMRRDPYHQYWSALRRTGQEIMWDAADAGAARDAERLSERASSGRRRRGSLTLDASVAVPRYLNAVDIHCMPGNYEGEAAAGDVYAASIYDRGVYCLTQGAMGPLCDGAGRAVIRYLAHEHPAFKPRRILDIGCGVGHQTLPYADAFPKAGIEAIDVAAPMLRYAHARAESLGKAVHFRQMNAERLDYPDESFDLVLTQIFLHETSTKAIRNITNEIFRVLRPGGMTIHVEQPQYAGMAPYEQFMRDWDTLGNNEPFWGTLRDMDLEQLAVDAGFVRRNVSQTMQPAVTASHRAQPDGGPDSLRQTARWFFWQATK